MGSGSKLELIDVLHAVRIIFILDQARNPNITRNLVLYASLSLRL